MRNKEINKIAQIKDLKPWTNLRFHGNTKKIGLLTINEVKSIVLKKREREKLKFETSTPSEIQLTKELIKESKRSAGTNYFKVLIEGNTGIYYASNIYGHNDYNKTRVFEKNPKTLKLMDVFNKQLNK
jgi:hypothetical protein